MVVRGALTVVHNNGHDKPEEGNERGTFSVKMVFQRERVVVVCWGEAILFKFLLSKYPLWAGGKTF